jgi:hypothetical protein
MSCSVKHNTDILSNYVRLGETLFESLFRAIIGGGGWGLTNIGEGLVFMECSERDQYFFHAYVGISLLGENRHGASTRKVPRGGTKYIRVRIVKLDIDDTVTCAFKYHQRFGILCRHIIAVVGDVICSMIDGRWRCRWRNTLQHYFSANGFDNMTQVLLKSLKRKIKACRCHRSPPCETYPVCIGHAEQNN